MKPTSISHIDSLNKNNFKLNNFLKLEINEMKSLINKIEDDLIKDLVEKVKDEFYDRHQYKWPRKKFYHYVNVHRLNPGHVIAFLESLMDRYFLKRTKGKATYQKFMDDLKKTKSNELNLYRYYGIHLKNNIDIIEFLTEMKKIKNTYIDISHIKFIKFLSENFSTGYTYKSLYNYYFDKV
jgi:hypothetical protein